MKLKIKIGKFPVKKALVAVAVLLAFAAGWTGKTLFERWEGKKLDLTGKTVEEFAVEKSARPKVEMFVMSFCPYGNQIEDSFLPVVKLLGDKVDWQPHYIVNKVNLQQVCQRQVYSLKLCQEYVQRKYFPDVKSCRQRLYPNLKACLKQLRPQALLVNPNQGYLSLHGRQELNQDVREVCAWNLKKDVKQWWNFITAVDKNCNIGNVGSCWQKQAKDNGFEEAKIQQCFDKEALKILAAEEKLSNEKKASASPTVFINGASFPPQKAYGQNMVLRIGKKVFSVDQYRDPETLKTAICRAFKKAPRECSSKLAVTATKAKTKAGNCGS